MGLFRDNFYSTKIPRRSGWHFRGRNSGFPRGSLFDRQTVRVAFVSSLISSLAVALLFTLFGAFRGAEYRGDVPVMAGVAPYVDPSERTILAAAKVRPVVVSIINHAAREGQRADGRRFRVENTMLGSGIIFQKKGGKAYIVTNAHVVQHAAEIRAVLNNGQELAASIVGKDTISDLAVLEVDGRDISAVAEIGDSRKLRVGETVIAVGNPLGFGDSLSMGIVSYTDRVIPISLDQDGEYDWEQEVIQTDAAINQGNSGGALANLNGEVVGINSMKVAFMGVEGIGFAIPMHSALPVMESLVQYGKVKRPYMGVASVNLSVYLEDAMRDDEENAGGPDAPDGDGGREETKAGPVIPEGVTEGVVVLETYGPAKEAGLRFPDIIVQLDDTPIGSTLELRKYLYREKRIGDKLRVTFYRDGEKRTTVLKLAEKEEDNE
ncbi:MAG: serine protease [Paenibacillaceae bacterium ZCTH02-B3]|nr:MAG: serine protease [Paenibacillaceae bacterium ZCTH02-B3]